MSDEYILRMGFKSTSSIAGSADISIHGTFTEEDVQDCIDLLQMAIGMCRRQLSAKREEPA